MKRALISMMTGAAMVLSSLPVMAGDTAVSRTPAIQTQVAKGPLAPAGAAGVRQAQGIDDVPLVWLVGAAAVLTLGIIALSDTSNNENPAAPPTSTTTTTTTTTTSTTGT